MAVPLHREVSPLRGGPRGVYIMNISALIGWAVATWILGNLAFTGGDRFNGFQHLAALLLAILCSNRADILKLREK